MSSGSPGTTNIAATGQRNFSGDGNSGAITSAESKNNSDNNTQRTGTSSSNRRTDHGRNLFSSNERAGKGGTHEVGTVLGLSIEY